MAAKYTVFDTNDFNRIYGRGLTAVEAMTEILNYDGYAFEIRKGEFWGSVCWDLYKSDGSANSTRSARHLVKSLIFSLAEDQAEAEREIAQRVIAAGWSDLPRVMPNEDFQAMVAQMAEEIGGSK